MATISRDVIKQENSFIEDFDSNIDNEVQLLYAMQGYRPVGVSKHFQMVCIAERLQESLDKDFTSETIWNYLKKLYSLKQLDENDTLPFPNEEQDFSLPDQDFMPLKQKKLEDLKNEKHSSNKSSSTNSSSSQISKKGDGTSSKDQTPIKNSNSSNDSTNKNSESKSGILNKKDSMQRRDSKDSLKNTPIAKKEIGRKDSDKKSHSVKGRGSLHGGSVKRDDETKQSRQDETPKRTTRGSIKPEETTTNTRKSQSPLTVGSALKRRRI